VTLADDVRAFLAARGLSGEALEGGASELVRRWEQAARDAEHARYPFGIEDWLNELDGRHLLEELGRALPGAIDGPLAARLSEADRRLRAATETSLECVWGATLAARQGWSPGREWWYWRRPRAVNEDFEGSA